MATRWDGDTRGLGIGDALQLVPGASELVAAFRQPSWVAEQPELHLLPHVEAWCEQDDRLALIDTNTDHAGAYIIDCEWHGEPGSVGQARAALFSLIGCFAESATYVRQRRIAGDGDGSTMKLRWDGRSGSEFK